MKPLSFVLFSMSVSRIRAIDCEGKEVMHTVQQNDPLNGRQAMPFRVWVVILRTTPSFWPPFNWNLPWCCKHQVRYFQAGNLRGKIMLQNQAVWPYSFIRTIVYAWLAVPEAAWGKKFICPWGKKYLAGLPGLMCFVDNPGYPRDWPASVVLLRQCV